ncbi:MAG: sigma-54 factor interaction domain-containing protein, partial [Acidobacteria bacterium]|nr:sigma-54 factor interaction domain-containing protein [Acidobacteriota bacterium]
MSAGIARGIAQMAREPQGVQPYWSDSSAMGMVMDVVDRVADSTAGVLLRGESGVGKEVIARELHRRSSRRQQQFVKVNCAALPGDLLESELFGYERGAFTGAGTTRIGKFEFANRGTILLDEIGEMPVQLQAKLLHVLQDGSLTRLGSNRRTLLRGREQHVDGRPGAGVTGVQAGESRQAVRGTQHFHAGVWQLLRRHKRRPPLHHDQGVAAAARRVGDACGALVRGRRELAAGTHGGGGGIDRLRGRMGDPARRVR